MYEILIVIGTKDYHIFYGSVIVIALSHIFVLGWKFHFSTHPYTDTVTQQHGSKTQIHCISHR